ncbi:MAG: hypothetical protein CL610_25675 [Anaerolineaceae bacterium]|nr:hypothetical protein [Anaerolineaceae bacterium]
MNEQPVVEVALFRLKPDVADDAFLRGAALIQRHLDQLNGYISRELVKAPDGQWVDIIHWANLEAAQNAEAVILADTNAAPFFEMIDESQAQMIYANTVQVYPARQTA